MTWPCPVRAVGVGSPNGDDSVGWEVIRGLGHRPNIEAYTVEGGQRILDFLDGQGTLVLIDALVTGGLPGRIHRFEWPDARIERLRPGSTHQVSPAEALQLARVLGIAPARVIVFGIEPEIIRPQQGLSPCVQAAVPKLVERITAELDGD